MPPNKRSKHVGVTDLVQCASALELFPSSGGLFVLILSLATFLQFPLCATCDTLNADHCGTATTADISDLAFRSTPICGIVVDSISVNNKKGHSRQRCPSMSMKRVRWTLNITKIYLLRSRESIISRCFSRKAFVASLPACVSSSSRLISTGFQSGLLFCSPSTRGASAGGASGIEAPIAAF